MTLLNVSVGLMSPVCQGTDCLSRGLGIQQPFTGVFDPLGPVTLGFNTLI